MACQFRFTTFERIEVLHLMVIKRDGSKQPFSKEKLRSGICLAAEKRPLVLEKAEVIADAIERDLYGDCKAEVTSQRIGTMVLEHLKPIDSIAYLRFASVYRSFDDLAAFEKELQTILSKESEEVSVSTHDST